MDLSDSQVPQEVTVPGFSSPFHKGVSSHFSCRGTLYGVDDEGPEAMAASKATNDMLNQFLKYDLTQSLHTNTIDRFLLSLMKAIKGEAGQPVRPYARLPRDRHLQEIVKGEDVLRYRREYCEPVQKEEDRYSPFCYLANAILESISEPSSPSICFVRNASHVLTSNDHPNGRIPDLVYVRSDCRSVRKGKWKSHCLYGPDSSEKLWEWTDVLGVGEVKITSKGSIVLEEDIPRPSTSLVLPFNHVGPVTRGMKKKYEEAMPTANKRQRTRSGGASSSGFSPLQYYELPDGPTRRRNPKLREDLVYQSARYVSDHMTMDVTRRHVLNLLISDGFLWLAYYDHQGVIYSPPLNFVDDLYRFAYVLKILNDFESKDISHFAQQKAVKISCLVGSGADQQRCKKTVNVLKIIAGEYPEGLEFVTGKRIPEGPNRIFFGESTQMMMVGTKIENGVVVPMTMADLERGGDHEDPLRWKHVLKWSYPYSTRISEPEMIGEARRVLGRYDDIPDPSGRVLAVKISNSLPNVIGRYDIDDRERNFRAFLGVDYEETRILRFTIFEYLEPIHSLDSLVHFKESIRHIALAIHYLAMSEESIKHRDINVNNLMFRHLGDNQIQGVLCDWDQASTNETEKSSDHTRMRNGTRAFMAIDMHKTPPPTHIERFDFESLFYVMYWISMNYSGGKLLLESERHPSAKEWSLWNAEDDRMVAIQKKELLTTFDLTDIELFPPFFQPLARYWLFPLKKNFYKGYDKHNCHRDSISEYLDLLKTSTAVEGSNIVANAILKPPDFDYTSLGGHVCFERIWEILSRPDL